MIYKTKIISIKEENLLYRKDDSETNMNTNNSFSVSSSIMTSS